MLFEKKIRGKRISPFKLEIVGSLVYHELIGLSLIIIGALLYHMILFWTIFFFIMIVTAAIGALLSMRHICSITLQMKTDKREKRILAQNIVIVDYDFSYGIGLNLGDYIYSFTHLFYLEPYIRIVIFNYLPAGERTIPTVPPKFYMEEVSITWWKQENYKELRAEFKQYEDDIEKRRIRYEIPKKTRRDYEDTNHTVLYMTYDKMQVFKKLFDLVNPHEFRITKYEKSWVFISIDPIPGKEYPPEALECMKKINAMYP